MGGDVWVEFAGAEGVAYLTGVFGFLAEEGNLTVGDDGAVRDVLADDGGAFVEVHEYKNPFVLSEFLLVKLDENIRRIYHGF